MTALFVFPRLEATDKTRGNLVLIHINQPPRKPSLPVLMMMLINALKRNHYRRQENWW